ncbi:MAG: AmmeMemoRadiSam system protein A [Deltaproteobacteria bacterium]|jgi:AmmeMemoRadiSam system protein A|nr:AmmeMemoRadiSam system protein A [Deltaproteobacteria bacterium]
MTQNFVFTLTDGEKSYLLDLAKLSIARSLKKEYSESSLPAPPGGHLQEGLGAFVTLKKGGRLRGCIGRLSDTAPLFLTVSRMALAAAFNDPRFPAVTEAEFEGLSYDISIMGPIQKCPDPEQIIVGTHGLIMKQGLRQGLLLPQVPVEQKWTREQFLTQTCAKAGLPPDTWKKAWKSDGAELYWFEAVVIG